MSTTHRRIILSDNIQGITKNDILRLSHRAGIKRLDSSIHEEARSIIKTMLEHISRDLSIFLKNDQKNTISVKHLEGHMKINNKYLAAGVSSLGTSSKSSYKSCPVHKKQSSGDKKTRYKSGTASLAEIRRQQKTACLAIRKLPFQRFFREVLQDYVDDVKVRKDVFILAQLMVENYLVHLFEDALLLSLHAKRQTVMVQDLKLALAIRKD